MAGRTGEAEDNGLNRGTFSVCLVQHHVRALRHQGGTVSSNPVPSTRESANHRSLSEAGVYSPEGAGHPANRTKSRTTPVLPKQGDGVDLVFIGCGCQQRGQDRAAHRRC